MQRTEFLQDWPDIECSREWREVFVALVCCLSADECCQLLLFLLDREPARRNRVLNRIVLQAFHERRQCHDDLGRQLLTEVRAGRGRRLYTAAYCLSQLHHFLSEDLKVENISTLLESEVWKVRKWGYKLLKDWDDRYTTALQKAWEQHQDWPGLQGKRIM